MSHLNRITDEVVAASTENDPRKIAAEILDRIPEDDLREHLADALVPYVASRMPRRRPAAPARPSAKVAAIRQHWSAQMERGETRAEAPSIGQTATPDDGQDGDDGCPS